MASNHSCFLGHFNLYTFCISYGINPGLDKGPSQIRVGGSHWNIYIKIKKWTDQNKQLAPRGIYSLTPPPPPPSQKGNEKCRGLVLFVLLYLAAAGLYRPQRKVEAYANASRLRNLSKLSEWRKSELSVVWRSGQRGSVLEVNEDRSRIHERTILLRFLGIILRVLRLEISVYNVYIKNQFQATFAGGGGRGGKFVSIGDCE
jgi:hypothetical protein